MNTSHEDKMEHILRRMAADRSVDAPADVIGYAKNLYRSRSAADEPSMFRRVMAALSVDLAPNKAAFGERSATGSEARQMLFDAGDNAVDIRVTPMAGTFDVRVQIMGGGFETGEAELDAQGITMRVRIEDSSFRFSGLKPGDHSLSIRGTDTEILVEKFIL